MASSERLKGTDSCSIQKFDGLPSKENLVEDKRTTTQTEKVLSAYPEKASFQTSISIKEEI